MAERVTRLLLDTSVVIADSLSSDLDPGGTASVSVITLGELRAGVRLAATPEAQAVRQARLAAVRQTFAAIPVDESVAELYGDVLAAARSHKRTSKATDLLIVATAAATGRTLLTLDHAQAALAQTAGVAVRT